MSFTIVRPTQIIALIALLMFAQFLQTPASATDRETGAGASPVLEGVTSAVRYRTVEVDGLKIFYREAGPADAPVILLLHGFPASSCMFRDFMVNLTDQFRLIAPDYPGFGYSDAPAPDNFTYTFDHLADVVEKFTTKLALDKYGIYICRTSVGRLDFA